MKGLGRVFILFFAIYPFCQSVCADFTYQNWLYIHHLQDFFLKICRPLGVSNQSGNIFYILFLCVLWFVWYTFIKNTVKIKPEYCGNPIVSLQLEYANLGRERQEF